jgi:uncharacterized protein with PIN domain
VNIRSIMRYMRILGVATAFSNNLLVWIRQSMAADSPGGVLITKEEWVGLADVFANSILQATGQIVNVVIDTSTEEEI